MSDYNIVTFSSLEFIFRFLPFFLIVFYLAPFRYKKSILLCASLLFYGLGAPLFLPLLLALMGLNCLLGRKIAGADLSRMSASERKKAHKNNKRYLIIAAAMDVGILLLCKVFLAGSLPLGISFYTFKMISYQADCYRRKIGPHSRMDACLYFCLFPQIVSGPVMRYSDQERMKWRLSWRGRLRRLEEGLFYFTAGLGAKMLLADRLGLLWHDLETIGFESISAPLAWLGAAGYSLQLYFDFAGYSLMAAGIGVMLGLPFIENFLHPYASGSIREFFRRWHISLGNWFRDYVYIPLGGSRQGQRRCILNLAAVWLLTGLWHGGSINFLLWGLLLFALVAAEKLFLGKALARHKLLGHIYVLAVMPVVWVIFAISDLSSLALYLTRMFPFLQPLYGEAGGVVYAGDFEKYIGLYGPYLLAAALCCVPGLSAWFEKRRRHPAVAVFMMLVFWCSIYRIATAVLNPFMYFSF